MREEGFVFLFLDIFCCHYNQMKEELEDNLKEGVKFYYVTTLSLWFHFSLWFQLISCERLCQSYSHKHNLGPTLLFHRLFKDHSGSVCMCIHMQACRREHMGVSSCVYVCMYLHLFPIRQHHSEFITL